MRRYGTDSEEEFLGDKEDLDRFKVPISGVSCEVDPSLLGNPLRHDVDEVGKRYRHIALKGVKQCFSSSLITDPLFYFYFFPFEISIKLKILVFLCAIYDST